MSFARPRVLLAAAATNADLKTRPFESGNLENLRFQVFADNAGTPVGTFRLQGSDDPNVEDDIRRNVAGTVGESALWVDVLLPANCVHGLNAATTFTGPAVTIGWDGSADANFSVNVQNPMFYMRVFYDNASAGSATPSLVVFAAGRKA